jgi:hypothetical protein
MANYEFRLRFNMLKGDHINSDLEKLELLETPEGQEIRLRVNARDSPIKASSEIAIVGGLYKSPQDARQAAILVRTAVASWAVKHRLGVDFGDGRLRAQLTDFGKRQLETELGRPLRNDRLGIDVYEWEDRLVFVSSTVDAVVGKDSRTFIEEFRQLMTTPLALSEKQMLAGELYSASYFDVSFRSRFITLVTAVEALLDVAPRSAAVQEFVDDAESKVEKLVANSSVKEALVSALERIRYESIGQGGRSLTERLLGDRQYDGLKASRFFAHCYRVRSEIVHSGKPSDPKVDLLQLSNSCQGFVGDLLNVSFGFLAP